MSRTIQRVPCLLVSELFSRGLLPSAPPAVVEAARVPSHRTMTLAEMASLEWWIVGSPEKPLGVLGARNVYDFHTSSDVYQVEHLVGTKRACVELIHFAIESARSRGRRCIGVMDESNAKMSTMLHKLGCDSVRRRWESR